MKPFATIAAIMGLLISGAASALTTQPTTLLPGTILGSTNTVTYNLREVTCSISGASPSTFLRNGAGPATITVTSISYQAQHKQRHNIYLQFYYSGAAVFNFTNSTSGTLDFDVAPVTSSQVPVTQYQNVNFKSYQQTYDNTTKALQVSFVLELPYCPLTVTAIYHGD
jgi:hypothetical protein